MRIWFFSWFLAIVCSTVSSRNNVFELDHLFELQRRSKGRLNGAVSSLLNSPQYRILVSPRNRLVVQKLEEEGVLLSWSIQKKILREFIKAEIYDTVEDMRYFHYRDAFREVGRSTVNPAEIDAMKRLLRSEFLALFTDLQFRIVLSRLQGVGFLEIFYSRIGDLQTLYSDSEFVGRWERATQRIQKSSKDAQARVSSMMRLARVYGQDYVASARRIRDSGYFEKAFTPEVAQWVDSDIFQLYRSYFNNRLLASSVQILAESKLLQKAIDQGDRAILKEYRNQALKIPGFSEAELLSFLSSPGFRIFLESKLSVELGYLFNNNLIEPILNVVDDLLEVAKEEYVPKNAEVKEFLDLRRLRREEALLRKQKEDEESKICHENMKILMDKREEYNLRYREGVQLEVPEKRELFFELIPQGEKILCPVGGEYRNTEFGWIFCTKHGKAHLVHRE